MELFTSDQRRALLAQGAAAAASGGAEMPHRPIVKLFCPWGGATWLLSEIDPDDPDTAFGLCDLGMGEPELGYVSLAEITEIRGPGGLRIERDLYFKPDKLLVDYAAEAHRVRRIVA